MVYPFFTNQLTGSFIFVAAGAVCGYVRMKNRENLEFISEENQLIREKFLFMRDLYQATLQDKKRYKKQILGSKDSFGKIFDITRKLDIVQPEGVIETIHYGRGFWKIETLTFIPQSEKRLWQAGSCISQVSGMYSASVRLSEYTLALETLEKGG